MKKSIFLLLCLLILSFLLPAQNGSIIFEQRINLHKRIGNDNPQMKAMLPEWQQWKTRLVFKDNQSLYKEYEDEESDTEIDASSGGMRIKLQRPQSITYHDLGKKERITQEEFMQKRYLITEPLPPAIWKLTGETREILGYNCQQAILQEEPQEGEEAREVVAWFTLAIPLSAGPATYGQLPGMILVIDIDNGTSTLEAKKIDLTTKISDKDISAPTKGTAMTREDFRAEQEKALEEMNHGGNRGMRIRF